ncbi:jg8011 [Pararge aegeria aegeria]|uniref:WD repeat-containing protein on Y chromosome n=1 Tax=Pararge aegeria aegeria TaxID=348720 RepID=A0A8S4RIZ0_9NEOP|nr:jg8011 [Pararge aegeria aegeria]
MANDSDVKSIMSISSRSEGSTVPLSRLRWRNAPLHERCSMADMLKIKEAFQEAYLNKMLAGEFRSLLRTLINVEYDDEEFHILFMKINTSRNGEIDWDELVSHLLLGYFANDPENQRASLQLPIMGLPVVMRSQHRQPVSRICFCPDVSKESPFLLFYLRLAHLKVRTTWVTDMVCLPDVNIVVTSSTERDLRFYDCTAKTFTLKIVITSWEYMICTMHYHFYKDPNEQSILICGDVAGNVRVLTFSPIKRGPFRNQPGRALLQLRHVDLQKRVLTIETRRLLPEMRLIEMIRVHSDWVRQVSFYASLHCIVSCSTCPDAMLMCDLAASKTHNMFRVDKGIQCFVFDEEAHVLATGGPDCTVRVWNPFVPSKANVTFHGHHAGVTALVLQNNGQTIYSLSRDRVIKVWDVQGQVCVQTYIDIPSQIGERTPVSAVYNPATREFILASIKIAVLILDEQLNSQHTDGFTHSRAVAKVLYNPLFKVVITCGMDSIIINWDPVTGKRNVMVCDAHTRLLHGELIPVEITAACFDPGNQLLLTGARNGTLKDPSCRMEPPRDRVRGHRHQLDGKVVGDASLGRRAGRGRTNSANPRHCLLQLRAHPLEAGNWPAVQTLFVYGADVADQIAVHVGGARESLIDSSAAMQKARARRVSTVALPARAQKMRQLAAHAMIFLTTRPCAMRVASLIVGLENGRVQCWSDHPAGGLQGAFQGIHTAGDYVSAFATDVDNDFLFTGTTVGYIKVWLMKNYLRNEEVHVNMPLLRLTFPFLWRDRVPGRAKRSVRDQPLPLLLSSYRAHLRCVTALAYIDGQRLVLRFLRETTVRNVNAKGTENTKIARKSAPQTNGGIRDKTASRVLLPEWRRCRWTRTWPRTTAPRRVAAAAATRESAPTTTPGSTADTTMGTANAQCSRWQLPEESVTVLTLADKELLAEDGEDVLVNVNIVDDENEDDKYGRRERGGGYSGPLSEFREKSNFRPSIKLEYVDDDGRPLCAKEAFRYLSHKFHGKGPGKNKQEKRIKKAQQEGLMKKMSSTDTPLNTLQMLQQKQKETHSPFVVLSGAKRDANN